MQETPLDPASAALLDQMWRRLDQRTRDLVIEEVLRLFGQNYFGGKFSGTAISGTVPPTALPIATTIANGIVEVDNNMAGAPVAITTASRGAANGVAELDGTTKVPVVELPVMGASGGSHAAGIVPDPGAVAGTTKFLREDATFAVPTGSGMTNPMTTPGDHIEGGITGAAYRQPNEATPAFLDFTINDNDLLVRKHSSVTSIVVGFIGDSITEAIPPGGTVNPGTQTITDLSTSTLTVTANNQGQSGAKSGDWISGSTYLTNAKTAFASAGVRLVHVMLGVNDVNNTGTITTAANYYTNMASMCQDLVNAGYLVVVSYPMYATDSHYDMPTLLSYQAQINRLANHSTIFVGDVESYTYFQNNPSELHDGLHPGPTGVTDLATMWTTVLQPLVAMLSGYRTLTNLPGPTANGQFLGQHSGVLGYYALTSADVPPTVAYAPLVNGDLPGPSPIATTDGQFIMVPV